MNRGVCAQVVAKAPVPGRVKTRLIPALGAIGAAHLHEALTRRTLATIAEFHPARFQLHCHPGIAHPFFRDMQARHPLTLMPQRGSNLGARMHHALRLGVRLGFHAILVGTDCPEIDRAYLEQAARALETPRRLVLGPATDGGYVLIGCNFAPPRALFTGVPWGTARVLRETLGRCRRLGIEPVLLTPLADIDRPEDLSRWTL